MTERKPMKLPDEIPLRSGVGALCIGGPLDGEYVYKPTMQQMTEYSPLGDVGWKVLEPLSRGAWVHDSVVELWADKFIHKSDEGLTR